VKTENTTGCATVNCKVCRSTMALKLPVVPSGAYKVSINLIQYPSYRSRIETQHVKIFCDILLQINYA
jgi:hypothetical protein